MFFCSAGKTGLNGGSDRRSVMSGNSAAGSLFVFSAAAALGRLLTESSIKSYN
jgi:hypothetical protein